MRVIILIGGISGDLAGTFDIQCGWLCAVLELCNTKLLHQVCSLAMCQAMPEFLLVSWRVLYEAVHNPTNSDTISEILLLSDNPTGYKHCEPERK